MPRSSRTSTAPLQQLIRRLLALHQRLVEATSGEDAVQAPSVIGGLEDLEARWTDVLAEFDALEEIRRRLGFEEVAGMPLGVEGDWSAHFLMDQRRVLPAGRSHCPTTIALVQDVEGAESAYFSVMAPGTALAPHRGPNKSILRGHLTLYAPDPGSAALSVGGQRVEYRPGRAFVFDDTVEHAAWNRGSTDRVTLMIDLRRQVVWWLRPLDAIVRIAFRLHPVRREAANRLDEMERARNG